MNKKELIEFVDNKKKKKNRSSLMGIIRNNIDIRELILKYTDNLNDVTMSQRCWHIYHDIIEKPLCKQCNLKVPTFQKNNWNYSECCSILCAGLYDINKEKRKITCLNKYGVDNYSKTQECKNKHITNNLKKWGVEHTFQSKNNIEKTKQTNLEKYGVNHYSKTNEFKEKHKQTCLEKYGVNHQSKTNEVKEKTKQTCLKRYGVNSGFDINRIKDLECRIQTCLNKYGVENPMQNCEISDKSFHNGFKYKRYILPSGIEVKVQGYESKYLNEYFLNNGLEENILIENKDIELKIGKIWYNTPDGKKHRYYPDCYLINENKIIEVKSIWTIKINPEIQELKKQACLDKGLDFEYKIYNYND